MKKFTEVISIEVPVQSIADLLLNNMHPDFKHKDIVAEAIVGRMMNDNSLSYLYNSLNGYPCSIDFQIGDNVYSEKGIRHWGYWTPESIEKNDAIHGTVHNAKVIEVNHYKDDKLKLEYQVPNKKGGLDTHTEWLNHTGWNRVAWTTEVIPSFEDLLHVPKEDDSSMHAMQA